MRQKWNRKVIVASPLKRAGCKELGCFVADFCDGNRSCMRLQKYVFEKKTTTAREVDWTS